MTRKSKPIDLRGKSVQEQADSILATLKARPTTKRPKPRTKRADGAEKVAAKICDCSLPLLPGGPAHQLAATIRRYASRAVAAERKRCEGIVEHYRMRPCDPQKLDAILSAIKGATK